MKKPNIQFFQYAKKIMATIFLALHIISFFPFGGAFAQGSIIRDTINFEKGMLWISIKVNSALPSTVSNGVINTNNSTLNEILNRYNTVSYEKAFPTATSTQLKSVYQIICNGDESQLMFELSQLSTLFNYVESISNPNSIEITSVDAKIENLLFQANEKFFFNFTPIEFCIENNINFIAFQT